MTAEDMKRDARAAALSRAEAGGDRAHQVTLVAEPELVSEGLWLIRVRLMMRDGTARAFECDATTRDVFAIRDVPAE